MSYEDKAAGSEHPAERRVWEAPQIITVVPVDRTEGGAAANGIEAAPQYKVS